MVESSPIHKFLNGNGTIVPIVRLVEDQISTILQPLLLGKIACKLDCFTGSVPQRMWFATEVLMPVMTKVALLSFDLINVKCELMVDLLIVIKQINQQNVPIAHHTLFLQHCM